MPFVEDLTAFLADFGEAVTLNGVAGTAIFDADYAVANAGGGVASTAPVLQLRTADVPALPVGKGVVVRGVNYTIAEHQPDGTGWSLLLLERA